MNTGITLLHSCISPETAHTDPDYPFGFRVRCQRRIWIETHPKRGQRVAYQTSNPKRPGLVWNAIKWTTFAPIQIVYIEPASGRVERASVQGWGDEKTIADLVTRCGPEVFADPYRARTLDTMRRARAKYDEARRTMGPIVIRSLVPGEEGRIVATLDG